MNSDQLLLPEQLNHPEDESEEADHAISDS